MQIKHNRLDWDSDFLGFEVGNIELGAGRNADLFAEVITAAGTYRLCYVKTAVDFFDSIGKGYSTSNILLADTKLTFSLPLSAELQYSADPDSELCIVKEETPELLNLAFLAGKYSRYRLDPNFDEAVFVNLYIEWLRKSLTGQLAEVVVGCYRDNRIAGFVTLKKKGKDTAIGLIAVHEDYQGKGIGKKLMRFSIEYAKQTGSDRLTVETQAVNVGACSLYASMGLKETVRQYIYHIWN